MKPILKNKNLYVIFSITLMAVLGISSITPAFPDIIKEFDLNPEKVGYLVIAFTLPGIIATPILGIIADRYGKKKILVPSLILFALSGSSITFIRDFEIILILRLFQGLGSAALGSLNSAIIADLFTGKNREEAMGINASVLSIGTALYPAIGGAIALISWKYVFLLSLLALPAAYLVQFILDLKEQNNKQNILPYLSDILKKIFTKNIFLLFTASVITFIILFGSYLIYIPIISDIKFSATSLEIGILMTTMSLTTAFSSYKLEKYVKKFGEKKVLAYSFFVYAIALISFPYMNSFALLFLSVIIFGFAHGANIPAVQLIIADLSPKNQRSAFMSINGTVLRIGQTLGPFLTGLVYNNYNLNLIFILSSIITLFIGIVILIFMKLPSKSLD